MLEFVSVLCQVELMTCYCVLCTEHKNYLGRLSGVGPVAISVSTHTQPGHRGKAIVRTKYVRVPAN